jgi:hypothetical protein
MPKLIDLTGKRFGRWVVLAYAGHQKWSCLCDCGARVVVRGGHLRGGRSQSCGCLSRELTSARVKKKVIDLSGRRFGRWTVVGYAQNQRWACRCDCGRCADVLGGNLRAGGSQSCGCFGRELTKARSTKHGMTGSREYNTWVAMKSRCFNPRHPSYPRYGGAGITVSYKDWISNFTAFFADTGTRPPGQSLDRIDGTGNYEPGNVKWSDAKQQRRNQRPRKPYRKRRQVEPPPLEDPPF